MKLREEDVRDILKTRRTYAHEAVALAEEVLELRAQRGDSTAPPVRVAQMLMDTVDWGETPQGYDYWCEVYDNLLKLVKQ